ncbi:hypothetical protein T484DRAFT_3182763 [Baffinella frigidus]|nr:hypothetical protein T484DRAFT_3182763 [Cryptophyta sp. CCMP2293]|mmetsp:Transcript_47987/g.114229  ORF Transcript_47987/g.114229 Transcript_47987/m.114229 type:complete len:273 (-) Transcript_47987:59-877(-)
METVLEDAAIEQYVILAKGAKGRAAVALIQQAISHPHLYHFGDILEHENIEALANSPDTAPWLHALRIFAYGTYAEYRAAGNLPPLDETQALKLKQLTVVSLAAENKVIPYEALLRELDLTDTRTVEDVIIEGMYAGLFKGKLDQKKKELQVHETAGRDCKPGQLDEMISTLQGWCQASDRIADDITDKIAVSEKAQEMETQRVKDFAATVEDVKKNLQGDLEGVEGAGLAEGMDMDDVSRPKSRQRTKHNSAMHGGATRGPHGDRLGGRHH